MKKTMILLVLLISFASAQTTIKPKELVMMPVETDLKILNALKAKGAVGDKYCENPIKHKSESIWLISLDGGDREPVILSIPDLTIVEVDDKDENYFTNINLIL